jgi:hypothetical protein
MFLLSRLAGDLPKAEPSKSSDHTLVLEGEPSQPQWGKVEKGCHRQRMFGRSGKLVTSYGIQLPLTATVCFLLLPFPSV